MADVILKNVCKIYPGEKGKDVPAVKDFNLEIADREFVVFVGPSGCGKSTTLRMIAGLEEISSGEVFIGGKRVNDVPPKDRDIAMVFQNYALYPHMSVFENMAFGLKLRKFPKEEIKRRVDEASAILGIGEYLDRKPKALSGGQRQRVAVGRAIVRHPKVFLFDEPLSNLDAKMRVQMRGEISRLHRKLEATMIYVTHDQVEAMTMGTRIVVMKDGVIQQVDEPLNVYNRPANLFVAGFLGSPPMNLVRGRVLSGGGAPEFVEEGEAGFSIGLEGVSGAALSGAGEVILGVRPEDCTFAPEGAPERFRFEAEVEMVEPMGSETYFHIRTGSHTLVSRSHVSADHRETGHRLRFAVNPGKLHLFDAATGETLGRAAA